MQGKWILWGIVVMVLLSVTVSAEEIRGNYHYEGTIQQDFFEVYHLNMTESNKVLDVTVKTNKPVDFYLLTDKEFDEYIDPTSISFHYEIADENTTYFHWRGNGNYYLVIDNMNYTLSGAMSYSAVNYTIDVKLENKDIVDYFWDYIGYFVCGTLVLMVIATSAWLYSKPKIKEVKK